MVMRGDVSDYFTVHEYGATTPKKVYVFGGWRSHPLLFRPLVSDLTQHGFAVVLFIPKKKLIAVGTPYAEIVKAARLVSAEVAHRVEVDSVVGVKGFVGFGISFGTLFAMEVAKRVPAISRLVLLSPFGDFARHVELWPTHRYFGKVLASQPTGREESGRVLNTVGAPQDIALLKGRKVLVGYSRNDGVIHTEVSEAIVRLMNQNGIDVETAIVQGGHLRGLFAQLALKRPYRKFLGLPPRRIRPAAKLPA